MTYVKNGGIKINFIIECDKDAYGNILPCHDFGYATIEATKYGNWYYNEEKYGYLLDSNNLISSKDYAKYIPVGSVEYVALWLKTHYPNCKIKPINIPNELFKFSNRDIKTVFGVNKIASAFPVFIKSNDKIKGFSKLLGVFDSELECDVEFGDYIVSQYVDIASEWRCFVENGILIDMKCYSGNFWVCPNKSVIENMISEYKSSPKSYSLDVFVDFDNNTSILEVHNFFSCGLYGFNDYLALLNMTRDGIHWQIKQ